MPFSTDDLTIASFLTAQGNQPSSAERAGSIVIFHFDDLVDAEVYRLLNSAEFRVCKAYHLAWRSCRRLIDATAGNGGGRR